jgi:hypothetical protein
VVVGGLATAGLPVPAGVAATGLLVALALPTAVAIARPAAARAVT